MSNFSPYATAAPFWNTTPGWLNADDGARYQSYDVYEQIYWNVPETFKLVARGSEDNAIYLPSARRLIETANRFLAKDFDFVLDPNYGTPDDRLAVELAIRKLFARESFYSKFATQKRYGLIRGDSLWHLIGDDTKPEGTRISIYELDPRTYFPIQDEDDANRIVGCHLAEPWTDEAGNVRMRRLTYRKTETGTISRELSICELDKWDDRVVGANVVIVDQPLPLAELPPTITALPVYHIPNMRDPNNLFGSSEMRGLERVIAGLNQSISDEDLTLALDGLGMYATDSGAPQDEQGNETDWVLGPGRVVELAPGTTMNRINGTGSVQPYQDHMKFLSDEMAQAIGASDVAMGRVDVAAAESGISLQLQLAPLLARNSERESEMLAVYDHMLYDLVHGWLPAYEGVTGDVAIGAVVGDPMPVNRAEKIKEIMDLVAAGLGDSIWAASELTKYGIDISAANVQAAQAERQAMIAATANDPFAERIRAEIDSILTSE